MRSSLAGARTPFDSILCRQIVDGFLGEPVAIDRDAVGFAESAEAVGVIGVLVGEQNAGERFGGAADGGEPFTNLPGGKTGVDEQARIPGLEIRAISVGAAA